MVKAIRQIGNLRLPRIAATWLDATAKTYGKLNESEWIDNASNRRKIAMNYGYNSIIGPRGVATARPLAVGIACHKSGT